MECADGAEGLVCLCVCGTGLKHGEQCETELMYVDNMDCVDGAEGLACLSV